MGKTHYDVVIAGAGISGALIANKLAQVGLRVALIDAGTTKYWDEATGEDRRQPLLDRFFENPVKTPNSPYPNLAEAPSPNQTALNKYFVQKGPDAFQSTYTRIVGGTTYHWLGTSLRLVPNTFRERTVYGIAADWPLSYEELESWYWEAEWELGVAADARDDLGSPRRAGQGYPMPMILPTYQDRVVGAAMEGLQFEGLPVKLQNTPQARNSVPYEGRPPCAGSVNCIPICPIQAKYDATIHIKRALDPARDPHATAESVPAELLEGRVVTHVELAEDGSIHGLRVIRTDTREQEHITGTHYVLAMHAVENPKVLLRSGAANDSDVVGRYLMDHDIKITYANAPEPLYTFRGPKSTAGIESLRDGPFRRHRGAFRGELQNVGTNWALGTPATQVNALVSAGLTGRALREQIAWQVSRSIQIDALVEPMPDPDNRVTVSETLVDGLGVPRPELHYRVGEHTKRGGDAFVAVARMIYAAMGATDVQVIEAFRGAGHLCGTTRMGDDPRDSCCNDHGRTWQHHNLWLTGSGLFPTIGTANPTLTIAALSLRTANAIAAEHGRRTVGIAKLDGPIRTALDATPTQRYDEQSVEPH